MRRPEHDVSAVGIPPARGVEETAMSKTPDYVKEIMTTPVVSVAPEATVAQALRAMIDHDIGAVVIADGDAAAGVFTERDLTRGILDDPGLLGRSVEDVMSSPVITASPDEEVVFVFKRMSERRIRRLPVLENDRLVGIVTERDLLRWVDAVASS
jgi:CBS domain-containing protein